MNMGFMVCKTGFLHMKGDVQITVPALHHFD
jgi:hypothetical protein